VRVSPLTPLPDSGRPFVKILESLHASLIAQATKFPSSNCLTKGIAPAPSPPAVQSCTVEDALCSMGLLFARPGVPDPRLNQFGDLDFRLSALLRAWAKKRRLACSHQAFALATCPQNCPHCTCHRHSAGPQRSRLPSSESAIL
jgi:hypothetical protein